MKIFEVRTKSLSHDAVISRKYTCDGLNVSLPLTIQGVPSNAVSLALIMDDSDIPKEVKDTMKIEKFNHWLLCNIPPDVELIEEGSSIGECGENSYGKFEYAGPCPPTEYEPTKHRYILKLFALDCTLDLSCGFSEESLLESMSGHVIETAELMFTFDRSV